MTKFHFLQFQKWPRINVWTEKGLKLPEIQFHEEKNVALLEFTNFFASTFLNYLAHCIYINSFWPLNFNLFISFFSVLRPHQQHHPKVLVWCPSSKKVISIIWPKRNGPKFCQWYVVIPFFNFKYNLGQGKRKIKVTSTLHIVVWRCLNVLDAAVEGMNVIYL